MLKKSISVVLVFVMVLCVITTLPFSVSAVKTEVAVAGSQQDDIVNVAISQIGVQERSSGSDDVIYNDWYYGHRVNNNGVSAKYAWCAVFVSWCAQQAGISEDIIPISAGTAYMWNHISGEQHLRNSGYIPQHGDIILFGNNAGDHIGIVDYTDGDRIYYIDGNNTQTNPHGVHYSSTTFSNSWFWGTVSPNYQNTVYDDPEIETWYYDGATDHSDFRPVIRVKNPETVSEVNFAVRYENTDWKWYRGDFNGGNAWYCDVLSSDLGTGTTITCHAYVRGKSGSYTGYPFVNLNLGKDADPVAINWYYDGATDHSDFRPVIRIANPESVSYVRFAVRYNSTDWKWYDGIFNGGNAWYCDVSSADLGSGQYIVCHAYVYAKNGSYKGYPLENLKLDKDYDNPILNKWKYETVIEKKEYRAVLGFENPETVASVRFAIRDNDSDWKWYDGIFDGERTWYYDIDTSKLGLRDTLYCHAYVQGRNGFYQGYPYTELDITETPTEVPTELPEPKTILLGDADGDGEVEVTDATFIQRSVAGIFVPETFGREAADVDRDNEVTVVDATFIQRYIAGIFVPYPVGEAITK